MSLGRLLLRATVGGFFVGHGTQKLFGSFGGPGLKATAEGFESMGMRPGQVQATAAGVAETGGGAGILLGYHTPLAASTLIAVMATAINRVHLKNGPWISNGGYEYNAVLIAALTMLAGSGPGALSLDALRGRERSGGQCSLFALVAGAAGAMGAHLLAESKAGSFDDVQFAGAGAEADATESFESTAGAALVGDDADELEAEVEVAASDEA